MPYWVVTSERDLMGPYSTQSKAQGIKDGLDDSYARVEETLAWKRSEAVQELRHKDVEREGAPMGRKNYKHGGEK